MQKTSSRCKCRPDYAERGKKWRRRLFDVLGPRCLFPIYVDKLVTRVWRQCNEYDEYDARRQSVVHNILHARTSTILSYPLLRIIFAECERKMARITREINAYCFSSNAAFNRRPLFRNPRVHLSFFSSFLRRKRERIVSRYSRFNRAILMQWIVTSRRKDDILIDY